MATPTARPSDNPIDDYALARIDYRVGRLVKTFRLCAEEAKDLRQDMIADLLKAASRHDPARSGRNTFTNRALDRRYLHVARALAIRQRHECRRPAPISAIPRSIPPINDPRQGEQSEQEVVDLAIDVAEVVRMLPPRLRRVCEELRFFKPSEVARRLGVHRGTVYRAIGEIRCRFVAAGLGDKE